ncbi:MAG TPA: response regulator [Candidatus Binatia bacterium]|nr:response regulator [Candidatus Binatia bacterium]
MKKLILIVEDHPDVVDLMQKMLEISSYRVAIATTGTEALEVATARLPNLIIMDLLLPEMDGLEVTAILKDHPKTRDIPILATTARALPDERSKCLAAGCAEYLAKPFSYKELAAAVENLLKGSERNTISSRDRF